jgi:C4-dicarboxylate transporter
MKQFTLATILALTSTASFAGGLAEPVMEPTVVAHKTSSSAGGILIPLLILILVVAAASSGGGGNAPLPD